MRDDTKEMVDLQALIDAVALAVRYGFGKLPWCDECPDKATCGCPECLSEGADWLTRRRI